MTREKVTARSNREVIPRYRRQQSLCDVLEPRARETEFKTSLQRGSVLWQL